MLSVATHKAPRATSSAANGVSSPNAPAPCVPLYAQLVEKYRRDILDHRLRTGDRVDSITRIQKKHGVSRETAKRVLRVLAEQGLIIQRPGKGSFVGDLRPKQCVWGLIFPFHCIQYEDLISRLDARARSAGRELHHYCDYNNWEEEVRLVGMMLNERYEAVVVIPTLDESRTWGFYSRLSAKDSPVILLDHTMTCKDFTFVIQSYDLGVVRAMDYMRNRRPGGIAFVSNALWAGRNMVLELMQETYREYLRRHCASFEPALFERANLVEANALRRQGITGIFCCDDVTAVRIIGRLREQGADVPSEFNVVSYGNTDLARFFTPPITSVDPHNDEMASEIAGILSACTEGNPIELRQAVVQPELVLRAT